MSIIKTSKWEGAGQMALVSYHCIIMMLIYKLQLWQIYAPCQIPEGMRSVVSIREWILLCSNQRPFSQRQEFLCFSSRASSTPLIIIFQVVSGNGFIWIIVDYLVFPLDMLFFLNSNFCLTSLLQCATTGKGKRESNGVY